MSKYIPAIKEVDNHFNTATYSLAFGSEAVTTYQDALNKASELAVRRRKEHKPIVRPDGFTFPVPKYEAVVLKEVSMKENEI